MNTCRRQRDALAGRRGFWRVRTLSAAVFACVLSAGAQANSLDNAYKLCAVVDATRILAAKCAVSSFATTVGMLLKARPEEASEFCAMAADMAGKNGLTFDPTWRIQIISPISGNKPVATCALGRPSSTARSFGLRPQLSE